MLLIVLCAMLAVLLLSRLRIWLLFAAGGVAFVAVQSLLTQLLEQLLPDKLNVFTGVLSFLLLASSLVWYVSLLEPAPDDDRVS